MNNKSLQNNSSPIKDLYQYAKVYSRRQEEVDDLIQDMFLVALKSGMDLTTDYFLYWGKGFIRKHSAFVARTEGRRKIREEKFSRFDQSCQTLDFKVPEAFILKLKPSLRILSRLVNSGLNKLEIIYFLNISETAFRQRLTALRKEWKVFYKSEQIQVEIPEFPICQLEKGLLRKSLISSFGSLCRIHLDNDKKMVGSHDPDGNLLLFFSK